MLLQKIPFSWKGAYTFSEKPSFLFLINFFTEWQREKERERERERGEREREKEQFSVHFQTYSLYCNKETSNACTCMHMKLYLPYAVSCETVFTNKIMKEVALYTHFAHTVWIFWLLLGEELSCWFTAIDSYD